jgi:hypothetical protein
MPLIRSIPARLAACALLGALSVLGASPAAHASRTQLAMFQEDVGSSTNTDATLAELRRLGVGVLRYSVVWRHLAPATASRGFDARDPASPDYNFSVLDRVVTDARRYGITVDLSVTGAPPLWAEGAGGPRSGYPDWKPSAAAYGAFVQALGRRYNGRFVPLGAATPLPAVHMWELWNEPNFGGDLAPQALGNSTIPTAAPIYRALVDAGWHGLMASGHTRDTVVIGNLDARGQSGRPSRHAPQGLPGFFAATKPIAFVRELYCVGHNLHPLLGRAAAILGCPTTAAGSRRFASAHPALFEATGFGDHPYPLTKSPARADTRDGDFAEFSQLPHFIAVLDAIQRAYHSRHRFAIYNNEFGFITDPPNHSQRFPSPQLAAAYINWSEYLSWLNPRIASTMQYLLRDPDPIDAPEYGGFATGLVTFGGVHKPAYDAYRLPIWVVRAVRHRRVLLWGCARPAHAFANPQVQIQFASPRGPFRPLAAVSVTDQRGYFETWVTLPRRGTLRLAWAYPGEGPVYSRDVPVS